MTKLIVRTEAPGDWSSIDEIHREAFESDRHSRHDEAAIVHALRAGGQLAISLVAEQEGEVVGHIAISPVSISDGTRDWYGLGPLAVIPKHQGRGIGQRLVRESLQRLHDSSAAGCVLLGDPEFYGRFGFKPSASLVLPGASPGYFQSQWFAGVVPQGVVAYHESFSAPGNTPG
jgi:putative acetyltransferase